MWSKKYYKDFKLSLESDKVDTVIGSSVIINGPITTRKDIKIEGNVKGDIKSKGSIFIGPYSTIEGNVTGRHVTVCGRVNGDVYAKGRIIVTDKACVNGNMSMENLVMDEGAVFNGISTMRGAKLSDPVIGSRTLDNDDDSIIIERAEQ